MVSSRYQSISEDELKLADKALWAYYHFIKRTDARLVEIDFKSNYLKSCQDFSFNAISSNTTVNLSFDSNTLYLCWHYPEYPILIRSFPKHDILVLIADDANWITDILPDDVVFNFRKPSLSKKLINAFRQGIPVGCMFDYCYPTSKSLLSNFLGYPSRTPFGIIKLACMFNYSIVLITYEDQFRFERVSSESNSYPILIDSINKKIENAILKCPSRWLLWPSINNRWQNVNYEL